MRKFAGLAALALATTLLAACGGGSGAAAAGGARDVKIAGINLLTFSPVFVADRLGYFKDEGLNVTIVPTNSGDASVQAMLGGSVQAVTTGFDTALELTAKGQATQHLAGMEMATIYAFVGGNSFPQIPADDPQAFVNAVRGKKFGVASSGSTGDTIARGLFREYGLNPEADVSIIAVGTGAAATAALQTGAVDALITYEPDLTKMVDAGIGRVVFDLRTTTKEKTYSQLPTSTLQATSGWIEDNPDTARALVRAVAKANRVLREDPQTALPVLTQLYPDLSPASVEGIYTASQSHFRAEISEEAYEAALAIYRDAGVVADDVAYEQVVATQFADEWASAS